MMRIRKEKLEFKMSQKKKIRKVSGAGMWEVENGKWETGMLLKSILHLTFNIITSEAIASIASSSILKTVQNGQRFSKLKIIKCFELKVENAIDLLTLR